MASRALETTLVACCAADDTAPKIPVGVSSDAMMGSTQQIFDVCQREAIAFDVPIQSTRSLTDAHGLIRKSTPAPRDV